MIDKSKIKTVFVDIDDTVWWFTENSKLSLRHVYDAFQLARWEPRYEAFRDVYLKKNIELWNLYHYGKITKDYLVTERFRYTLQQIGVSGGIDAMSREVDDEYLRFLANQHILVPGAKELLEYLNAHYRVHALSNGFKGTQQQKLLSGGIDHLIDRVIISDDCGITKPMRGIFDYALRQCNAEAESTVMIGDNVDADVIGAKNAGWHAIYFNIKGTEPCTEADATVNNLCDIVGIL
ncbi:MAG: YjjG family noncanonical pyrimidine nucleotidase [Muribaculaceae bacterium]